MGPQQIPTAGAVQTSMGVVEASGADVSARVRALANHHASLHCRNPKSRVTGDYRARFCGSRGLTGPRLPDPGRLRVAKYSVVPVPAEPVGISVISPSHLVSGESAWKLRRSKSGNGALVLSWRVNPLR